MSDAVLYAAIASRNREALLEMFHRHGGATYGLACRICGPRQAEEVVSEVFTRLSRQPDAPTAAEGNLRGALLMHTRRLALETVRADRSDRADRDAGGRGADALEHELSAAAVRMLGAPPKDERDVIILAYYGRHTCEELSGNSGSLHARSPARSGAA